MLRPVQPNHPHTTSTVKPGLNATYPVRFGFEIAMTARVRRPFLHLGFDMRSLSHLLQSFCTVALGALAFAVLTPTPTLANDATEARFFKVLSANQTVLHSVDALGKLTWSNAVPEGEFTVVRSGRLDTNAYEPYLRGIATSTVMTAKVTDHDPAPGMVFIPGGRFTMGDILGDLRVATPVHPVQVSPFYLQRYEVQNSELVAVYQWALDQGLVTVRSNSVFLTSGATNGLAGLKEYAAEITYVGGKFVIKAGKERHPAVYVSWYGSLAYCNFLSMIQRRELCYNLSDWSCDFTKRGYRLPTEAEWELAARGGHEGRRFTWPDSDLITHEWANYRSSTNNAYDVSPTRGFHPRYAAQQLRTSPVGEFPPNSFGLYDMCGNVWEWCWDYAARYLPGLQIDPVGPTNGIARIFRGGSNFTTAERVSNASRYLSAFPYGYGYDTGFRVALRHAE